MNRLLVHIHRKITAIIKRGQHLVVIAGLLGGIAAVSLPVLPASALNLTPTPKVSFTFDDGYESFITKAAPVLAEHNLTGTAYVTTDFIGDPGFMTWEQTAALQNDWNWEIGAHTATHPELPTISDEEKDNQLRQSKETLAAHGIDAVSFASPFGAYDDATLATSARYFTSHRGFHDIGYNTFPYNDQLLVNQQVQIGDGGETPAVSVTQAKAYVDEAIANNNWLVLTFHDITGADYVNQGTEDDAYAYPVESLNEIAAYVASKVAAQSISAINVRDGLITGTNLLPNGNFTNGIADGWSTDKPANITVDDNNNGSYPGPARSISLTAADTNGHLFSPQIAINATDTYLIKTFLKITAMTGGEISFYVDEYDTAGAWVSGQYHAGVVYPVPESTNVRNANFLYMPTSATVAKASLQVIVTGGSGIQAYLDNVEWLAASENTTLPPADTIAPVISAAVDPNAAYIVWKTDEPFASAKVEYGATAAYGTEIGYSLLGNEYISPLGNLVPGNYYYRITATDAAGNLGTKTGEFTIPSADELVFGDLTGDRVVNNDDATLLFANWGASPAVGDLDNNGVVNNDDATLLFANWSK
jgi:peptidoglycan/xylan/chitin deacetylase (PgdA/CDA1 family)